MIAERIGTRHLIWEYGLLERTCTPVCMCVCHTLECNNYNAHACVYLINILSGRSAMRA